MSPLFRTGLLVVAALVAYRNCSVSGQDEPGTLALIARLNSPKYAEREIATAQLGKLGMRAVPPLVEILLEGSPESSWRAARALDEIALTSPEDTALRVARIYKLLSYHGFAYLGNRAIQMRERWKEARVEQTIATLTKLGAVVDRQGIGQHFIDGPLMLSTTSGGQAADREEVSASESSNTTQAAPADREQLKIQVTAILAASAEETQTLFQQDVISTPAQPTTGNALLQDGRIIRMQVQGAVLVGGQVFASPGQSAFIVTLGRRWSGDLSQLDLLAHLPSISVLNIDEQHVTADWFASLARINGLQLVQLGQSTSYQMRPALQFMKSRSEVTLQVTGTAFLGVTAENITGDSTGTSGCRIKSVLADSAAENADLQVGDLLTTLEGVPISTFEHLVVAIASFSPGDRVELEILRGEQAMTKTALLGTKPPEVAIQIDND